MIDLCVFFFYSASEIAFNLIGLTSTVFHSELIEIFSCDTKKQTIDETRKQKKNLKIYRKKDDEVKKKETAQSKSKLL